MKMDLCFSSVLVSSLLAVTTVGGSELCKYNIAHRSTLRHTADKIFLRTFDILANDVTERNITLLENDLILQPDSDSYQLTPVMNDRTIPEIRWVLSMKRCIEPGYNENLTVSLSERVEPQPGCRDKFLFILATPPETTFIPKLSHGVIDVEYETDHPDTGNRTMIVEIRIGKCALLTCNLSYAGSDKVFVMHKRDDRYWWIGTDVDGNDCNTSYNIWIGCSWQLKFFPNKTYSSFEPVTVRFSDASFCSLTKVTSPSSSDYSTTRDSTLTMTTDNKSSAAITYTAFSSVVDYLVTLAVDEAKGSTSLLGSTITRQTNKTTAPWYFTTHSTLTSSSRGYLTSELVSKTISKGSLASPTHPTEPNKTIDKTDRATTMTTSIAMLVHKEATLSHVVALLARVAIPTNKPTDSLTMQHLPNSNIAKLFSTKTTESQNLKSTSDETFPSQSSTHAQQTSRFKNWLEESVNVAVLAAVAGVIVTLPIWVGLIILIRKIYKKSSIAPSARRI